jgi:hypothetical protein
MERSVVEQQLFVEDTRNSNEFHHLNFYLLKKRNFNKKSGGGAGSSAFVLYEYTHDGWDGGWSDSGWRYVHHHPSYLVAKERR